MKPAMRNIIQSSGQINVKMPCREEPYEAAWEISYIIKGMQPWEMEMTDEAEAIIQGWEPFSSLMNDA